MAHAVEGSDNGNIRAVKSFLDFIDHTGVNQAGAAFYVAMPDGVRVASDVRDFMLGRVGDFGRSPNGSVPAPLPPAALDAVGKTEVPPDQLFLWVVQGIDGEQLVCAYPVMVLAAQAVHMAYDGATALSECLVIDRLRAWAARRTAAAS